MSPNTESYEDIPESDFEDRILKCKDCKQEFRFSSRDQQFYARMKFQEPRRCKPCRDILKSQRES